VVIPEDVTEIGQGVFSGCTALTAVTLPSSIQKIGVIAFKDCKALVTVTIPDSVTKIEFDSYYEGTFTRCNKLNLASQAALRKRGWDGSFF
jgi:hypothetical protein